MRRHLYYYTHIQAPLAVATRILRDDPAQWLPGPAAATDGDTWTVDLRADGALPQPLAVHRALVTIGPAGDHPDRLLRTVTWRSASAAGLFPVLDGDLELVGLWGGGSQLSLMGTYRPPLSVAGAAGDALLGHRVAEACVRRFVLDVAERTSAVTLGA